MTDAEVRRVLNQWSDSGVLRQKHFGDKIVISSATDLTAYVVQVATQSERRTVTKSHVSTSAGQVPGPKVSDRAAPVRPPRPFEDGVLQIPIEGTSRLEKCEEC